MDFPEELRLAEGSLKRTEEAFMQGRDGVADGLLTKLSSGVFSSDVETAREKMRSLDESRYVKWDRWAKEFVFSAAFWKNEGYPSIAAATNRANNPDWYSVRTGTSSFVRDLMVHRTVQAPTLDGKRGGTPTATGNPSNRWLLDYVALSSLRLSFKGYWEQMVRDIVRKRSSTNLVLVAELLGLTIQEVLAIARKIRDLDDRVIEHDSDSSRNLMYMCARPDPSLTPIVDILE